VKFVASVSTRSHESVFEPKEVQFAFVPGDVTENAEAKRARERATRTAERMIKECLLQKAKEEKRV